MASPQRTPEASGVLELRGAGLPRRGVTIVAVVLAAIWLLGGVSAALPAAGDGSSGFGSPGDGSASVPLWRVIACLLVVSVFVAVRCVWPRVRWGRRRRARLRAVELAAPEAAEDDPAFASERVRADAASLFAARQAAWDARDVVRLGQLVGSELLAEWTRRLDDFARKRWHNRVAVDPGRVETDYVGLANRTEDREDRRLHANRPMRGEGAPGCA